MNSVRCISLNIKGIHFRRQKITGLENLSSRQKLNFFINLFSQNKNDSSVIKTVLVFDVRINASQTQVNAR